MCGKSLNFFKPMHTCLGRVQRAALQHQKEQHWTLTVTQKLILSMMMG